MFRCQILVRIYQIVNALGVIESCTWAVANAALGDQRWATGETGSSVKVVLLLKTTITKAGSSNQLALVL